MLAIGTYVFFSFHHCSDVANVMWRHAIFTLIYYCVALLFTPYSVLATHIASRQELLIKTQLRLIPLVVFQSGLDFTDIINKHLCYLFYGRARRTSLWNIIKITARMIFVVYIIIVVVVFCCCWYYYYYYYFAAKLICVHKVRYNSNANVRAKEC